MNTKDLVIKKENLLETFLIGLITFLSTLKISTKQIVLPILGQLFGVFLISLAPILEYREMLDITQNPDGWLYITLSVIGLGIFLFFLWKFFIVLAGVNLLARDIYDNRAIANLSFYTSDILRKKWSYLRFLIGYSIITMGFIAFTTGVMYLQQKFIPYNILTNLANIMLISIQAIILLTYLLFSNIAIQGYTFNRILSFGRTISKIVKFIKTNIIQLTLVSILTICFSNIIAYLVQAVITFLITNPFELTSENSLGIAIRFSCGMIINGFIVVLFQYNYARFYLVADQDSPTLF